MLRALLAFGILLLALPAFGQQTLKIATVAPEGSTWMREMRAAAEATEKATEGRVKVRFYPGGVMGNDATVLRKIRLGQLHGGAFTGSELTAIVRDAQLYSLPFLFRSRDEIDAVRAEVDPILFKSFEDAGWQVLSLTGVGFAYLMSNESIADRGALESRKVWVPHNDVIADRVFRAGGISPIPLPLPDVFTALQTGLVDTVGNTPAGAIALQWHGKLKQVLDLPLTYIAGYVLVSGKAWDTLSEPDRAAVLGAFRASGARVDADNRRSDAEALQALQDLGVTRVTLDPAEARRWEAVGEQVMRAMGESGELTADTLARLQSILATRRAGQSTGG